MPFTLEGTTFSGHSFKTTVGNTLNSIFQTFYYLEQAGYKDPWKDRNLAVFASGDDVVLLTIMERIERIKNSIRSLACPDKTWPTPYGIAQVIGEVTSGSIEDMSFLSKTFHYNAGRLFCHPDYVKMLSTKEYYMGENREMHSYPWEYMELKRLQYGPASENMDTLLRVARDFHSPK